MLPSDTDCSGFAKTMNQYCAEVTKLTKILLHAISRSVAKVKGLTSSSGYHKFRGCFHILPWNIFMEIPWWNHVWIQTVWVIRVRTNVPVVVVGLPVTWSNTWFSESWLQMWHDVLSWVQVLELPMYKKCTKSERRVPKTHKNIAFDCAINRFSKSILIESIIYVPENKV